MAAIFWLLRLQAETKCRHAHAKLQTEFERRRSMNLLDIAPLERWTELEKKIHQKSGLDVNLRI
jgi:hypothetical protein